MCLLAHRDRYTCALELVSQIDVSLVTERRIFEGIIWDVPSIFTIFCLPIPEFIFSRVSLFPFVRQSLNAPATCIYLSMFFHLFFHSSSSLCIFPSTFIWFYPSVNFPNLSLSIKPSLFIHSIPFIYRSTLVINHLCWFICPWNGSLFKTWSPLSILMMFSQTSGNCIVK